jgi:transposase
VQNQEHIVVEKAHYDALRNRVEMLQMQLSQLQKMIFGSKHERVEFASPNQLLLDLGLSPLPEVETKTEDIAYTRTKTKVKAQPNRSPLPADLPREVVVIEPEEDTTGMKLIGFDITEQLEMTPASFFVKQYKRAKYARPESKGIAMGKLPEFALPKAIAGSSVIAHLLVSKYVDHLPLYRQLNQFSRIGMSLSDSTVNDWVSGGIHLLQVLYDKQKELLLSSGYIQKDETPIKVLDSSKKGQTHRGYFWVSHSPGQKIVVFTYNKGRSASFPLAFLTDYQGYLQTDGYGVYDQFQHQKGITLLGCMAHARRFFIQARDNDKKRSDHVVSELQLLYRLEEELREGKAEVEEIYKRRQAIAMPILNRLHQWFKEHLTQVPPQSPIGKAIAYALGRWTRLMAYAQDGALLIDNNGIENQIRPVAIGRKNYMFCGSHESAQRAAIIYSLLGTCKLHHINPQEWLHDVFKKLPERKANQIDDLLPQNWKITTQDVV